MQEPTLILFVRFRTAPPGPLALHDQLRSERSSDDEPAGSYCGWVMSGVNTLRSPGEYLVSLVGGALPDGWVAADAMQRLLGDRAHVSVRGVR